MKGAFKILAISFGVVIIIFGGLAIWGLSKLPSALDIKKSLTPPALAKAQKHNDIKTAEQKGGADTESSGVVPAGPAAPPAQKDDIAQATTQVLLEDFLDSRKPLVQSCKTLEQAASSEFLRDPRSASAKYFFKSLAEEKHDPLVETAAPILRYIFRAPGMQSVVDTVLKAEETQDFGLLKKAEFYYEIYRAGDFLKNHKDDMDEILQKSYNMHHLAKAVAQKPELARDAATLSFCEQMEKNVNEKGEYNADEAAGEMMKFLGDAGIDPKSIGYDPNYRSKVKLNLSSTQVTINDTWVVQLFARDIQKASKEPAN